MGRFTASEERANALIHGLGFLLSLAGVPILVVMAAVYGDTWRVVSCSIYGASLVVLYGASTLSHLLQTPRYKQHLSVIDQVCIYLLIAGTYTPFTLVARGPWGWTMFGLVWGFAAVGIACKLFSTRRSEVISTVSYVAMGWLALIAIKPVLENFPLSCILWLLAGGVSYTVGVAFYAMDHKAYMHAVWHVFVLAGSTCHYVAVLNYVVPREGWA